ncbi:MAG: nitroreductase family protein [Deltaproteobacteria bacterium]|nr:nitroreductase family protein [Deltaproteobacteria bacterium]
MNDSLLDVMRTRRSVRSFRPEAIDDRTIARLLTAATWAPTAGNAQPWYFYVTREEYVRRKLAEAALGQVFVAQAPMVIICCADLERARAAYKLRGETLYCIQDTAAATQNLLLMAHALGLGACWVGAFDENAVIDVLYLPKHHRPLALVPVGYPAQNPVDPGRLPLHKVFSEID